MQSVTVDRDELLAVVKKNRDQHRSTFDQAFAGFRMKVEEKLREHLDMLQAYGTPPIQLGLVVPQDHTDDYDQVIAMLEMSVESSVVIQHHEFEQYVLDEWGWKPEFNRTTTLYSGR